MTGHPSWNLPKAVSASFAIFLAMVMGARAEVPTQIGFQGRIELPASELRGHDSDGDDNGDRAGSRPFSGTGRFKFVIVTSTGGVLWTNVPGSLTAPPPAFVSLSVKDGIFSVALGDPSLGMPPVTAAIFDQPDRSIRVFFQGEIRDGKGRLKRTTAERELLPAQKLLTVPYAFAAAGAQEPVSRESLQTLLAGATIQGAFAVAQNAVVLGSAVVHGSVRAFGPIGSGNSWFADGVEHQAAFGPRGGTYMATPVSPSDTRAPWPVAGGGSLGFEAAGGAFINQIATGPVSIAAGGGMVLISTPAGSGLVGIGTGSPQSKLHVAGPAGTAGDVVTVSTGASALVRITGAGEVRAAKFIGDGSGLTGISGGGGGGGAWLKIADEKIIADADGFSTISGLDINSDGLYRLHLILWAQEQVNLYYNGDETDANYFSGILLQRRTGNSGAESTGDPTLVSTPDAEGVWLEATIMKSPSGTVMTSASYRDIGFGEPARNAVSEHVHLLPQANLNSIKVRAGIGTNGIKAGSRLILLKVAP